VRAPLNRRVFVIGYGVATPLGATLATTWEQAVRGAAGFRRVTLCDVDSPAHLVGEIPDFDPLDLEFVDRREAGYWDARYVFLTMHVIKEALASAGLVTEGDVGARTACLMGSALNGSDSMRTAVNNLANRGSTKISPFLLPNLCSNVPSGKAGMLLGFQGPIFAPNGACASGNHAIGIGARMIRDGDVDFVIAGGADAPIMPEIIHGFANMNAVFKVRPGDRAEADPGQASRPFSVDRRGFVLSEGAGALVLASEDAVKAHGLTARAEVLGVGWTSDAYHFTKPNAETIIRCLRETIDDAELQPEDIDYVNAHGTSTPRGDSTEVQCLREVFGEHLARIPVSSNKSQFGHTLGGSAAIEATMTIQGMQEETILPTINHVPDPELAGVDVVPNHSRKARFELALSNAFGFGGTNCCVVFRGV
jgi:3-oxoacyl-[acyl-carrier-protein] synthase II